MEWLLGRGADWRLADNDGQTALECAKQEGEVKAAGALEAWIAERGSVAEVAEMQRKEKQRPLLDATRAGDGEAVRRCLRDGAGPNAADWSGMTALQSAAQMNEAGGMEALAEAGADLDKADGDGSLMIAAFKGHTAAVEWLLGRGAEWRLPRMDGKTALDPPEERAAREEEAAGQGGGGGSAGGVDRGARHHRAGSPGQRATSGRRRCRAGRCRAGRCRACRGSRGRWRQLHCT